MPLSFPENYGKLSTAESAKACLDVVQSYLEDYRQPTSIHDRMISHLGEFLTVTHTLEYMEYHKSFDKKWGYFSACEPILFRIAEGEKPILDAGDLIMMRDYFFDIWKLNRKINS